MYKKYLGLAVSVGTLVLAGSAFAAGTINSITFEDPATGVTQPNVSCDRNEVVQAHMNVTLNGSDLESISYDNHDGLSRHRFNVLDDQIIDGVWDADFDYACPSHGGTQSPTFWAHGLPGNTARDDFAVNSTAWDNLVLTNGVTVSNVVSTVTPSVPSSTPTPSPTSSPAPVFGGDISSWVTWLSTHADVVAAIRAALQLNAPSAPAKPAYCASMVMYTGMNTDDVQDWLLGIPQYAAGFHAIGVYKHTGYYGPVTTSAYAAARAACL